MKRNTALTPRDVRGYRVQLYAADKTTKLYDEVPFSGQVDYGGAFCDSSWIGKIEDENVMLPSALTFGWLEPNKKYYIRVQTLAEPVVFDSPANGYFEPDGAGVTMTSLRGGCAWSNFVELTTDAPHVPTDREVFYEGFDDMMFNSDIMNVAPAVVPQFLTVATKDKDYKSRKSAALYKAWVALPFEQRKFSEQGFNTMLGVYYHGLTDIARASSDTYRTLNSYAGSLEGWSVIGAGDDKRTMNPNFGSVRLGESGKATGHVRLCTKPIHSDKLSPTSPKKCVVRVKVSSHGNGDKEETVKIMGIYHYRYGEDGSVVVLDNKNTIDFSKNSDGTVKSDWSENYTWQGTGDYLRYPTWFEVTTELNLCDGDFLAFDRPNVKINGVENIYGGCLTIGEVTIEVVPEDTGEGAFVDNGIGTEPDDTNYDVYGLGEFPISFWWTVPTGAHNYDPQKTYDFYKDMADSGINVVNYVGEVDCSVAENKRIMDVCSQLGMKFIGQVLGYASNTERIAAIKEHLASDPTYVGEHLRDEPSVNEFGDLGAFVDEFNREMPDKEVYINLFPKYANAATQLRTDYENYIDSYLENVKTKSLSYDYYGLHKTNGLIFTDFYTNLDLVREKTLKKRIPFWVITQSGVAGSAKMPTEEEQRWSVWANIASGSKGIAYFCYWTPSSGGYEDNGFMINLQGEKNYIYNGVQNNMYDWVKKINADINTVGKKLLPCHADGAILTNTVNFPMFVNNGLGRTKYGPIQTVTGSQSILCGCFRDARRSENGPNYKGYKALVMSELHNRTVNAYLTLDPSVTQITFTHNNTTETVALSSTLSTTVGGIAISYDSSYKLTLGIPSGEAILLEF